jgi:hypothetical protein
MALNLREEIIEVPTFGIRPPFSSHLAISIQQRLALFEPALGSARKENTGWVQGCVFF